MDLLINELSFHAQARNNHDGIRLMNGLIELVTSFKKLQKANRVITHSTFHGLPVAAELSVLDCLRSLGPTTERQVFFQLATKGPFIDHILQDEIPAHTCVLDHDDLKNSSLAGAAYVDGSLASLSDSSRFSTQVITVSFSTDGAVAKSVDLHNFSSAGEMTERLELRYVPSAKHAAGGFGTRMDLDPQVAKEVLNRGLLGPNGRQIYSFHDRKIYEFQPDGTGSFHGYPISSRELPTQVLRNMLEGGMIDTPQYRELLRAGRDAEERS